MRHHFGSEIDNKKTYQILGLIEVIFFREKQSLSKSFYTQIILTKCPEGTVLDKVIENNRNHCAIWGGGVVREGYKDETAFKQSHE